MAHYRKIDTRISLDRKFNALPLESKLIFFHLLTHMHLTSLGAMKMTLPGLACEVNFTADVFDPAFQVLCDQQMVLYDPETHFLWLPQFLKYNAPESPNAIRAWESALSYLPECHLKNTLMAHAVVYVQTLSPAFQEALPKTFLLFEEGPSENFPPIPSMPLSSSQKVLKIVALDPTLHDTQANCVWPKMRQDDAQDNQQGVSEGSFAQDNLSSSGEDSLNNRDFDRSVTHAGSFSATLPNLQEALPEDCLEAFGKTSGNPSEGLAEDLPKVFSIQGTKNKEQITKNKEQKQEQEQKQNQIVLEKNLEKKLNIEAITHIVAPTRKKIGEINAIEIRKVFEHWKQTLHHPQANLDDKRHRLIRHALASGYSVAQLCEAINGCAQTPHNLGDNERGQRYDGLHIILRDADQIDRFIQNAKSPPRPQNAADRLLKTNMIAGNSWLSKKLAEEKTYG